MIEFEEPVPLQAVKPRLSVVKPAIPARRNALLSRIFYLYVYTLMKQQFFAVRVKNGKALQQRNLQYPTLCMANHCNWWDGLTDFLLISRLVPDARFHIMIEQLHRFPLLSYLGGFSVEKESPSSAVRALQYAGQLLESNPKNLLWIYPQGTVRPQEHRPLEFSHGVGYLAEKVPNLNIIPVAQYYSFLREDRPEIFIQVGDPIRITPAMRKDRKGLSLLFEETVADMLASINQDLANADLQDYTTLLQGTPNPFKVVEEDLYRARDFLEKVMHPTQLWKLGFK